MFGVRNVKIPVCAYVELVQLLNMSSSRFIGRQQNVETLLPKHILLPTLFRQ